MKVPELLQFIFLETVIFSVGVIETSFVPSESKVNVFLMNSKSLGKNYAVASVDNEMYVHRKNRLRTEYILNAVEEALHYVLILKTNLLKTSGTQFHRYWKLSE